MTQAPAPSPKLRLGTRRSPLAMAQAEETRARLCAAHGWTEAEVELVPVVASGDKVLDRPLAEIGGKALWTKELDQWLAEGEIDASVHSAKDVETERPASFTFGAVLPRADVRDCLLGADSIAALPPGARVGTSAPRRAAQLLNLRPDCVIVPMRGNVQTRLGKLAAGEADATFLAAAGLARLEMLELGSLLEIAEWVPAAAQGAIAIECRAGDAQTRAALAAIDDAPSHAQVLAERALLAGLGGNCHSSVAVHCHGSGELAMHAVLFSPDGRERVEGSIAIPLAQLDSAPGMLARELLARAPDAITRHFAGRE